jgi:hypothetical protein
MRSEAIPGIVLTANSLPLGYSIAYLYDEGILQDVGEEGYISLARVRDYYIVAISLIIGI